MEQANALQNPPMTYDQVLDSIALHAPQFAASIRQVLDNNLEKAADTPHPSLEHEVVGD